jgi:hypothetical protein
LGMIRLFQALSGRFDLLPVDARSTRNYQR